MQKKSGQSGDFRGVFFTDPRARAARLGQKA
jgi:hypothetical protein